LTKVQHLPAPLVSASLQTFIERVLESHVALTGEHLIPPGPIEERVSALFDAPFVALAHDASPEPIYSFGNAKALQLWEMSFEELTVMPSSRCAEPMHRDEREQFLSEVAAKGFADSPISD
jgi:hypothetical protein